MNILTKMYNYLFPIKRPKIYPKRIDFGGMRHVIHILNHHECMKELLSKRAVQ